MQKLSSSVERNLKIVFVVSGTLLLLSSVASYVSIQKLISSSEMVNHTYQVLIGGDNIAYDVKDAEASHRGYLLTKEPTLLQAYRNAYTKILADYAYIKDLTRDNPRQQDNLKQLQLLIDRRFAQFENVLNAVRKNGDSTKGVEGELFQGKVIMDQLTATIQQIEGEEKNLLAKRTGEQETYLRFTPLLIVLAASISILITLLAYYRIRKDLSERIAKQADEQKQYEETSRRIRSLERSTKQIAAGDYTVRNNDNTEDELGKISAALNNMAAALEKNFKELEQRNWLQSATVKISEALRGHETLEHLANSVAKTIATELSVPAIAFYTASEEAFLQLQGGYGLSGAPEKIAFGEGLAGQAALSKKPIQVQNLPADHFKFSSAMGTSSPVSVTLIPVLFGNELTAVIEIAATQPLRPWEVSMLEQNTEAMGIAINAVKNRAKLQELLEQTQAQAEELQVQHSELENINAELEAQAAKLQTSEEELKVQQEELMEANQELEERTRQLEERNALIVDRNIEIQQKAEELAVSTKYKSEFLANMSHELRTPLNSILLLSRLLSENNESNLTGDQIEYANVIQSSGQGLLSLIDEILDLSKIEAGKMELEYTNVMVQDIVSDMKALFAPLAREKKIAFDISVAPEVPSQLETDKLRLEQVLRNLLSNAIKFTSEGSVQLSVTSFPDQHPFLVFSVKDTGIGIPEEKQSLIFEAFQQADGTTRRKYGGTGLGLSISRELVRLLGGEIRLSSEPGKGSEFSVYVPKEKLVAAEKEDSDKTTVATDKNESIMFESSRNFRSAKIPDSLPDDRAEAIADDKTILIIEDDTGFAKALLDFTHQQGYKGLVAVRGDEGIALAQQYKPVGILLDIQLPVKDGWEVMEELKANPATRHIPVHMMSAHESKRESLQKGAVDFISKPVAFEQMQAVFKKIEHVLSKEHKKVLIVEENPQHAKALAYFLETFQVAAQISASVNDSVNALQKEEVDCVILDMGIPDQAAYETLEVIKQNPGMENLPIIIFTGKSLSKNEESRIRQYASSIVVKTAHSYQRILDEVSLFLHLVETANKKERPSAYKRLGAMSEVLSGKKILVTDDDVRNIFSLTKALELHNVDVVTAMDGREALKKLEETPGVDAVLMDIMMPEMDGYVAMQEIRKQAKFRALPIIAITAKAMTGDREKCIKAGASDYISKPVDIDQLLSLLRVWLYDKRL